MSDTFILVSLPVPPEAENPVIWRVGFQEPLRQALSTWSADVEGGGTLFDQVYGAIAEIFIYGRPVEDIFAATTAVLAGLATAPRGTRVALYGGPTAGPATREWTKP